MEIPDSFFNIALLIKTCMRFLKILNKHGLTESQLFIRLFVPYKITPNGIVSEFYDDPDTRSEMKAAFEALNLDWQWTVITMDNLHETVDQISVDRDGRLQVVFNYCDGDEINGYPGLSVVRLLEEKGIPFTGADSGFYHISTSKLLMKKAFEAAGVPTAPYVFIDDPAADLTGVCATAGAPDGAPVFVKPVISGGSYGLTWESVVRDDASLKTQVELLFEGMHGFDFNDGGVLAERFILGADFTVLVSGTPRFPENCVVYPALQMVYDEKLPEEKHHFVYDMWKEQLYVTRIADPEQSKRLGEIAWAAFLSVGGTGYGRIDLRWEKPTGNIYVLEVNANCSISSWVESDTICGKILQAHGYTFAQFLGDIIGDALERYYFKGEKSVGYI